MVRLPLASLAEFFPTSLGACSQAIWSTSFPGSLFSASLGRWKKDPGCGWSHDHPESGWQKNLLGGRGGRVFCLVDVTNFVGFKSFPSSR